MSLKKLRQIHGHVKKDQVCFCIRNNYKLVDLLKEPTSFRITPNYQDLDGWNRTHCSNE